MDETSSGMNAECNCDDPKRKWLQTCPVHDCTCNDPNGLNWDCPEHGEPAFKREFDRGFNEAKKMALELCIEHFGLTEYMKSIEAMKPDYH